jgi:hypothetical protein
VTVITEDAWRQIAAEVSKPEIADALITLASKTKYFDLAGYMERDWLYNPFHQVNGVDVESDRSLPSIRVHHILRADLARHKHDHPWDARTIILKGWYKESREPATGFDYCELVPTEFLRKEGDTARLRYGEYHNITEVSEGGVWTMFIMGPYQGTWGFLVDGVKIPWREYEKLYPQQATVEP